MKMNKIMCLCNDKIKLGAFGSMVEYYELFPDRYPGLVKVIHAAPNYGHSSFVFSVCFSPDGALLSSGSSDNKLMVWNLDS